MRTKQTEKNISLLVKFPRDWLDALEEIRATLPDPKPETSWLIRDMMRRGMPAKIRRRLSINPHRGIKRQKTPPE